MPWTCVISGGDVAVEAVGQGRQVDVAPLIVPCDHRPYSRAWKPLKSGSASAPSKSSARPSITASLSGNSSATGSISSHGTRAAAYSALACSVSPARTASVNFLVLVASASVWAST